MLEIPLRLFQLMSAAAVTDAMALAFIPRQADVVGSTRSVRWMAVLEGSNIPRFRWRRR